MKIDGVWLPIITPFKNNELDLKSYKKMIDYYLEQGISGIIPLGTTGESPTVNDKEFEEIVSKTLEYVDSRVPTFVGLGGNDTDKLIKKVKKLEKYNVDGILSATPYYSRPSQEGIYQHFSALAEETNLDIIVYNIPYRTGRNIENETIFRLAEINNISAIKDCCGDIKQSMELLKNKPENFSILTGEDHLFYFTLVYGGDGGILASAHMNAEAYLEIYEKVRNNDHQEALKKWEDISDIVPLIFKEPNPAPLKYCLKKMGLIESSELRLPLLEISEELERELDQFLS
ncbi:4-hydroxy-tetrahydrodipicolinate synthase [Natronospora cellulosivora (SeqCode)]